MKRTITMDMIVTAILIVATIYFAWVLIHGQTMMKRTFEDIVNEHCSEHGYQCSFDSDGHIASMTMQDDNSYGYLVVDNDVAHCTLVMEDGTTYTYDMDWSTTD